MPTYEYRCSQCNNTFETIRSYAERESDVLCPKCGLKSGRVYSVPGIQFKGTGFYKTGG